MTANETRCPISRCTESTLTCPISGKGVEACPFSTRGTNVQEKLVHLANASMNTPDSEEHLNCPFHHDSPSMSIKDIISKMKTDPNWASTLDTLKMSNFFGSTFQFQNGTPVAVCPFAECKTIDHVKTVMISLMVKDNVESWQTAVVKFYGILMENSAKDVPTELRRPFHEGEGVKCPFTACKTESDMNEVMKKMNFDDDWNAIFTVLCAIVVNSRYQAVNTASR